MAQHKWHKEIKHWADGGEIEMGKDWYWMPCKHEPIWNDKDVEYRIKPQLTRSYKDTIIERLRTDDEFWNEVFSAYDKKCDDEKPQLKANCCKHGIQRGKCTLGESDCKEPQYLYVFWNGMIKRIDFATEYNGDNEMCKYIGKIKLEDTE